MKFDAQIPIHYMIYPFIKNATAATNPAATTIHRRIPGLIIPANFPPIQPIYIQKVHKERLKKE